MTFDYYAIKLIEVFLILSLFCLPRLFFGRKYLNWKYLKQRWNDTLEYQIMKQQSRSKVLLIFTVFSSCLYLFDLWLDDAPVNEKTIAYKKKLIKKLKRKIKK